MMAQTDVRRRCRSCAAFLSRYNPSNECASCERQVSAQPESAASVVRKPKRIRPRRNIGSGRDPETPLPARSDEPFPARVTRLRLALGLSQKQFADRCGLLVPVVGHIEAGRNVPTLVTFERLCAGLGVTMDELWRGVGKASA